MSIEHYTTHDGSVVYKRWFSTITDIMYMNNKNTKRTALIFCLHFKTFYVLQRVRKTILPLLINKSTKYYGLNTID